MVEIEVRESNPFELFWIPQQIKGGDYRERGRIGWKKALEFVAFQPQSSVEGVVRRFSLLLQKIISYFQPQNYFSCSFSFQLSQMRPSNPCSPDFLLAQPGLVFYINPFFGNHPNPVLPPQYLVNSNVNVSFSIFPNSPYIYHTLPPESPPNTQNPQLRSDPSLPLCNQQKQLLEDDRGIPSKRISTRDSKNIPVRKPPPAPKKKHIKKPSTNSKQDPRRNIVTNIGNQILTFATNKSKCLRALGMLPDGNKGKDLSGFFSYSRKIRSKIGYYLNYSKMRSIWYPKEFQPSQVAHQKTLRSLSYFYLTQLFRLIVLNSVKMQKKSKGYHLKAVRKLIKELRSGFKLH